MKVSNHPTSNVLAGLVSAAVLIGSAFSVAHAEDGAQRLIELRTKTAESRASLSALPTPSDVNTYLVEDGSKRFKDMLRSQSKSQFSADHSVQNYLVEDGSERLHIPAHRDRPFRLNVTACSGLT
ncbi:hypothetical protein EF096_15285 [Pseudomonas neustonica]|mgnify:CR=1 FL=1|uniref:Uncharacterized protein n=1 Tax=Pseudomonas neustonica TaxID=2487346 RepID=A0ABX9XHY8_9PSED|nr:MULTISPECIES: hypothetical protein [Pseudomonas]ROZ81049.1 hypothetical protein EF099_16075 [Pseudomonas sp. SSM44]ROZ82275.1 hypothetical protein EF096_15285 [Pseudomonas neustonica]